MKWRKIFKLSNKNYLDDFIIVMTKMKSISNDSINDKKRYRDACGLLAVC